jgi:hypothetical protein
VPTESTEAVEPKEVIETASKEENKEGVSKTKDREPEDHLIWRDSMSDRYIAVRNFSVDNRELTAD